MTWDFEFTLHDRPAIPAGAYPGIDPNLSRHHIIGQKYLQVLKEMAQLVGVAETTLKRFAGWPINQSSTAPPAAQFNARFIWSPYNLFVGPDAEHRVFDPSSGVEQQRPRSFPEDRWLALKAIPEYFDSIGVPLAQLVRLPVGEHKKWRLQKDKQKVRDELTALVKAVSKTFAGDHPTLHNLHVNDWRAVLALNVKNFSPRDENDVAGIYERFRQDIVDVNFAFALGNDAYKFLMVPAE